MSSQLSACTTVFLLLFITLLLQGFNVGAFTVARTTIFVTRIVPAEFSKTPIQMRSPPSSPARRTRSVALQAAAPTTLKPAAIPLMDSGKALARSGEFIVDLTTALGLYGGALSASGAQIRNAGDSLAQAAASMRFKTGAELVVDELREAGTCLQEAAVKLKLAVEEAGVDEDTALAETIGTYGCK